VNPKWPRILFAGALGALVLAGCHRDPAIAHFERGKEALGHMDLQSARTEFNEAIRLSPSSRLAGQAFYQLGRMDDLYNNDPQNAVKNYMKSLENLKDGPARQRASLDLATDLEHLKEPDQALAILGKLDDADLVPAYRTRVWDLSARILEHNGQYKEALAYYRKVVGADPDSFEGQKAQFKTGLLMNILGDSEGAAKTLKGFIGQYPKSPFGPVARFNLALSLDRIGHPRQALDLLLAIQNSYPNPEVIQRRIMSVKMEIQDKVRKSVPPTDPAKGGGPKS
jgi:tetratricopeptide (TPR) repeat protein